MKRQNDTDSNSSQTKKAKKYSSDTQRLQVENVYRIEQHTSSKKKYTTISICTKSNFDIKVEKGYSQISLNMRQNGKKNPLKIEIVDHINNAPLDKYLKLIAEKNLNMIALFGSRKPMKEFSEVACGVHYATGFSTSGTVRCYVIGEGINRGASTLISHIKPNWDIVTIDPLLPTDITQVDNITIMPMCDYQVDVTNHISFTNVVVLGVHSHNIMDDFIARIKVPYLLVNLVCCTYPQMGGWYARFCDPCIVSDKNEVFIWRSTDSFVPDKNLFFREGLVEIDE